MTSVVVDLPDLAGPDDAARRAALRHWLRRFEEATTQPGALVRVWAEAGPTDDLLSASSADAFDRGRRQMAQGLEHRSFGDVDAEAVVMLALIEGFGTSERTNTELDAVVHIIERGLLAGPPITRPRPSCY
jgi:hypothetical protein